MQGIELIVWGAGVLGVLYGGASVGPSEPAPYLDLPEYTASGGSGAYTGFNSVNLQEIYLVQKQPAVRSQISPRGGHKPCLALLPNGEVLATQTVNGEIGLCRSTDQGASWGPPQGTGFKVGPGGRAAQFGVLRDGTFLIAVGDIHRSEDGGKTWQKCEVTWSATIADQARQDFIFSETDGFHELADGTVVCSGYVQLAPGKPQAYLLRSRDGGQTWGDGSYIADASEVNLTVLPGNQMFACLRVATEGAGEGGAMPMVVDSADGGRTWTKPRAIGLGRAQIPGYPLRLKDGRLLLVYGNRQFPHGAQAIGSRDNGKTWDTRHPIILAWFSWDHYCGMPRSLVMPDGSILTGYYARIFKESESVNQDVVGQTVHWRAPDDWPQRWPPAPAPVTAPAGPPPRIEVPAYTVRGSSGAYTGFNSVNLQEIYLVEKRPAVRSHIARGGGKPVLVRLPSGDLLASQYQRGAEGEEHPALCRSADGGLTWSEPGRLGLPPGRAALLAALPDGSLILGAGPLYRSTDEGTTWTECSIDWSQVAEMEGDRHFGETGGPTELPDGTLLCSFYIDRGAALPLAYVIRSRDGGRMWGDINFAAEGASEISFVALPHRRILGVARYRTGPAGEGGAKLGVLESSDQGRTWTPIRPLLGEAQVPGFPLLLPDGRLLIIYGHRQFPFGAQAIASRDYGQTWDLGHPILLAWFSWDHSCGHPRSLLLPDGSILTGYYASVFKGANSPLVSHALRWRPPDDWPPAPGTGRTEKRRPRIERQK